MDQLKVGLQVLLQYRFWVICAIVTLLPLGTWFTTTARLRDEFTERKTAIESKFTTADGIRSTANHPNDKFVQGMDQLIAQLRSDVAEAWEEQYDKQKNILTWPDELGQDFIAKVEKFQPIESLPYPTPIADELPIQDRELYRNYIKDELPKLAEIIGAEWRAQAQAAGGYGGYGGYMGEMSGMEEMGEEGMEEGYAAGLMSGAYGGAMTSGMTRRPDEEQYVVIWNSQDQGRLMSRFDWSGYPDKVPKTLDILYAQEDLWVYKAIMNIVARTNRGATANYNATVKNISYINLGRAVRPGTGRITRLRAGMGAGSSMYSSEMYGEEMYGEGMDEEGMGEDEMETMYMGGEDEEGGLMSSSAGMESMYMGESGSMGMGMTATASRDPAHYRYVDNNYAPISAERLRQALDPANQNPEDAFLVVAKRIPIRLGVVMDQRKVPRLIAECGNAELMVEVRQVRINRQGSSAGAGMGGMGDAMGGMMSMGGGGMPGFGGFGGFGGYGEESGEYEMEEGGYGEMESGYGEEYGSESGYMSGSMGGQSSKSPNDMPVEIYGMIYIYNPVDMNKLGTAEVDSAVPAEDTGEPVDATTTPAATATDATANG